LRLDDGNQNSKDGLGSEGSDEDVVESALVRSVPSVTIDLAAVSPAEALVFDQSLQISEIGF
jgi:hypothetical protein